MTRVIHDLILYAAATATTPLCRLIRDERNVLLDPIRVQPQPQSERSPATNETCAWNTVVDRDNPLSEPSTNLRAVPFLGRKARVLSQRLRRCISRESLSALVGSLSTSKGVMRSTVEPVEIGDA